MECRELGRVVASAVRSCLQDENNRREFEEWYRNEYGHEYQWQCRYGTEKAVEVKERVSYSN